MEIRHEAGRNRRRQGGGKDVSMRMGVTTARSRREGRGKGVSMRMYVATVFRS